MSEIFNSIQVSHEVSKMVDRSAQTFQKYPTQNGVPSIFPSTTVKPCTSPNTLNVFQNKNGIPEILPSQTIKVQPNGTKEVYSTQYGIPNISPS